MKKMGIGQTNNGEIKVRKVSSLTCPALTCPSTHKPACSFAVQLILNSRKHRCFQVEPKVEQDHNMCACVCDSVCVCVQNPGFSPLGTCTNTLPIRPLSFTFKASTRSTVSHSPSQSRPLVLSLFIDQGWF